MGIQARPVSQPMTLDFFNGTTLLKSGVTKISTTGATFTNGVLNLNGTIVGTGVLAVTNYVTTFAPTTTPSSGTVISFIPDVNSPANATLNGALIKKNINGTLSNLALNDLTGGIAYTMTYNGTTWVLAEVDSPQISAWTASTVYKADQVVIQGTRLIKRIAAGTSAATFSNVEAATWTLISNEVSTAWVASTYYYAGETFTQTNGRVIQGTTSRISGATFTFTEASFYTLVEKQDINPWTASSVYYASEVVQYKNGLIKSGSTRLAGATFDATEGAQWISIAPGYDAWTATTYYYTGTIISGTYSDRILQRASNGITAATFTLTEAGFYNVIKPVVRQVFTPSIVYYRGEQVTDVANGSVTYSRVSSGLSGASLATDLSTGGVWTLVGGVSFTSVSGAYTVKETDDLISYTGGSYTITVPATRVNPLIKFATTSLSATPPTIAFSGGETATSPSTYAQVTSFVCPGTVGLGSSVQFQKAGTTWIFVA